jgi:hypothetical protein
MTFGNQIVCQRTPRFFSHVSRLNREAMTDKTTIGPASGKLLPIRKVLHLAIARSASVLPAGDEFGANKRGA